MEKDIDNPIIKFRMDYLILLALVVLAFISLGLAGTKLGLIAVAAVLILAGGEAFLLLWHYMGLRYMKKVYSVVSLKLMAGP